MRRLMLMRRRMRLMLSLLLRLMPTPTMPPTPQLLTKVSPHRVTSDQLAEQRSPAHGCSVCLISKYVLFNMYALGSTEYPRGDFLVRGTFRRFNPHNSSASFSATAPACARRVT